MGVKRGPAAGDCCDGSYGDETSAAGFSLDCKLLSLATVSAISLQSLIQKEGKVEIADGVMILLMCHELRRCQRGLLACCLHMTCFFAHEEAASVFLTRSS